ncbi:alpha/beta hydrolase [Aestuariispira insulae]|uniref:Phospholipase/carboxylesterase n=1 Tax=Aestuariispira insulae TaxID=1461337 RepID=A0A3D9HQW0_9PROT|nr:prolyl oligopeptidase family serine peptidase [Aestuariispira insulae]RED51296.1 phospholipase/carboxylesterase [Aestuariispira insulae]
MSPLSGPEIAPHNGVPPKKLVILLHGYGSNGRDLIDLAHPFSQSLPDTHFIAPDAPDRCEISPFGYQWFSLLDRSPAQMQAGVAAAGPLVDRFIDEQRDRFGLQDRDIALVGFSQGTMLSLAVGLARSKPLAGILGYSGRLLGEGTIQAEAPPVMLVHGTQDDVVPYDCSEQAAARLAELNVSTQLIKCEGLGHSIDQTGLISGLLFLKDCFSSKSDQ